MDIAGTRAFVTGAARGIGLAIARDLARAGADIIGCDLDVALQAEVARIVEAEGRTYTALAANLADLAQAQAVVAQAAAIGGGFDILVNNAGIATSGPFAAAPFDRWLTTLQINLIAPMAICHAALPHLQARPAAHVVNISSVSGVVWSPGQAAYTASKWGVSGFTRCLELEYLGSTVGITCVHPSSVATRMTDGIEATEAVPMIGPDDVSQAVVRAIREGQPWVFVPEHLQYTLEVLPRMHPNALREAGGQDATSQSWLTLARDIPDRDKIIA